MFYTYLLKQDPKVFQIKIGNTFIFIKKEIDLNTLIYFANQLYTAVNSVPGISGSCPPWPGHTI